MDESLTKHRASPRVLALNEVQDLIDTYLRNLGPTPAPMSDEPTEEEEAPIETDDQIEDEIKVALRDLLTKLHNDVVELYAGHPTKTARVRGGTHFVGVKADGTAIYLKRTSDGYSSDGEVGELSHIYGPWNTKEGAKYAIAHNMILDRPEVS